MEIAKALKSHPEVRVRMGIYSGPVNSEIIMPVELRRFGARAEELVAELKRAGALEQPTR